MELFDTRTTRIQPLPEREVRMYVCGVTPYDTTHLGHAFTFVHADVLARTLRRLDRRVVYVQNVTDIDDSILARARRDGVDWQRLGNRRDRPVPGRHARPECRGPRPLRPSNVGDPGDRRSHATARRGRVRLPGGGRHGLFRGRVAAGLRSALAPGPCRDARDRRGPGRRRRRRPAQAGPARRRALEGLVGAMPTSPRGRVRGVGAGPAGTSSASSSISNSWVRISRCTGAARTSCSRITKRRSRSPKRPPRSGRLPASGGTRRWCGWAARR